MSLLATKSERIHSLDSLRAIMMLLGVVLHSALTYGVVDYKDGWGMKDPFATNATHDFIVHFIHMYRMPLFFLIAGFFGALLFYERGTKSMIKNRFYRLVLPFIVFLLVLWPMIVLSFGYTSTVFKGDKNVLDVVMAHFSDPFLWIPVNTFHLWFLYYLILFTFSAVLIALLIQKVPVLGRKLSQSFSWFIKMPVLRVLILAAISLLIYVSFLTDNIGADIDFIPTLHAYVFHFYFYLVGWMVYKSKHLLSSFMKLAWVCTILGLISTTIQCILHGHVDSGINMIFNSIQVWLFIFGLSGLFIKYGSKYSAKMKYISDSSYWVYLLHLPLTALIPGLIVDWPIPAFIKFLIVTTSTACSGASEASI